MEQLLQWAITTAISILTFVIGQRFERHRLAQQNRIKLLEPIEEWVDQISRLMNIVGDELVALGQGLDRPVGYSEDEWVLTGKLLGERKNKVLGILNSKALNTFGTKKTSDNLAQKINILAYHIERDYLQIYYQLYNIVKQKGNPVLEMQYFTLSLSRANSLIQEIHGCISVLKTKFN